MKRSLDFEGGAPEGPPQKRGGGGGRIVMPYVLKFLTPEMLASAVIGKGGQVISAIRQATQSKIGLTEHNDFYPGTDCRVLTAQANSAESLTDVALQIIAKLAEAAQAQPSDVLGGPGELKIRTLVPRAAVGGIIGKGGVNIKQLREQTGAKIHIGEASSPGPGSEQIVAVTGAQPALEFIMAEINKQIQALQEEPWFQGWAASTTGGGGGMGGRKLPRAQTTRMTRINPSKRR